VDVSPAGSVGIVGGGVIGLSIAFELASLGRDVSLFDPTPGKGASWAAAGMLSPAAEVAPGEESLFDDLRRASVLWPLFAERIEAASGLGIGFVRSGSILVGSTSSDARDVARTAALIGSAGFEVEPVGGVELGELEPTLRASARGGWVVPDDFRVDNRQLVEALLEAAKALGVRVVEDRCTRLDCSGRALRLSLANQGSLEVDACVLATGSARPIDGTQDLGLPPVRPVRGATIRLGAVGGVAVPTRTIRAVVDAVHCYVVPRLDRSVVVGATSEERGFDEVAPAGGVFRLLEAARTVFPGIDELTFKEAAVGLRPATADHIPHVARLNDARVIAALGHYRNGVLLSPLAGERVAQLLESFG
jgi:glycine oxidase